MSDLQIKTFGCRLNIYESEVMRAHAEAAGLDDMVIVNTCAVTAEAERQARQAIRKLRRERPDTRIVVTGCAAQIAPAKFAQMAEVDHVLGNDEKMRARSFEALAADVSGTAGAGGAAVAVGKVEVSDIMSAREVRPSLIDGRAGRARSHVQIQNGCDHRCTFCVIPFGRGNSRSVPADEIVTQVRHLTESDTREVVLTGVDITAYGRDLADGLSLGGLVRTILREVPDLARLRLSSIDSIEVDHALMDAIADEPRLMPYLHLSLQAGDDLILKRMKRRHLRDHSIRFCREMRQLRPDMVFGADLIAGFPTESEEMFARTLDLVDECGLTNLHVFPFSPRPETPAARMPQVARALVKERAGRLRAKGRLARERHLEAQSGRRVQLLMEREGRGRTPQFTEMDVASEAPPGTIIPACVTGHNGQRLIGDSVR